MLRERTLVPARPYSKIRGTEPSVTTIIDILSKPGLSWGAARETAMYAVLHHDEWLHMDVADAIDKLRKHHAGIWNGRAAMGTLCHKVPEAFAAGEDIDIQALIEWTIAHDHNARTWKDRNADELTETALGYVLGIEAWWADHMPEVISTETVVRYPGKYIGTGDLRARIVGDDWLLDWKGLSLDTPIPTPAGWTTMGAIAVGDSVFGHDGAPVRVVGKSAIHEKDCYRVTFDDGSSVVCDYDHRWLVTHMATGTRSVKTTIELADDINARVGRGARRRYGVVNPAPLDLPDADLPLDPYLLGAWLGDGTRCDTRVSLPGLKAPVAQAFRDAGFTLSENPGESWNVLGFRPYLRACGQMGATGDTSIDKHVPRSYLRGSQSQRLALLQGLMDTDGTWNKKRRQAVFDVVDKQLAADVYELVVSLGWHASQSTFTKHGFGLEVTVYRVAFTPHRDNPFRHVAHKRDAVRVEGTAHGRRRLIVSVEPTVSVPTQCIAVDSPDHTYLCGEQMVPTHNSTNQQDDGKGIYVDSWLPQLTALAFATETVEYEAWEEDGKVKVQEVGTGPWSPPDRLGVIHLRGDEGYTFYELPLDKANHDVFLKMVDLVTWRKGLPEVPDVVSVGGA